MSGQVYSNSEIEARLQTELPFWHLTDGMIRRRYQTNDWKSTLMVINTVGHLSEVAFHHPDIAASYNWVEVSLVTHSAKGVTDKDFALARKFDEIILWQPGQEKGALDGLPDKPRFAYVKPD